MALKSGRVGIHPSQVDPITGMLINIPTPGNISFEDLSDAQISSPEVGQTLIYNGNKWENEFSSISPTTLATLQDVQITDPEDGDYLTYDAANSKWINSGEAPAPEYTDITVTMYGAVEDTISFTDAAGISHSEVFASGQSIKSVTFKINPSGSTSITFTSAVAKDPDNLSNDYTKTVSVTSATTEIKVMPDNALYWWGYELMTVYAVGNATSDLGQIAPTLTHNKNSLVVAQPSGTRGNMYFDMGDSPGYSKIKEISSATVSASNPYNTVVLGPLSTNNGQFTAQDEFTVIVPVSTTSVAQNLKTLNISNPKRYIENVLTANAGNISLTINALWYE